MKKMFEKSDELIYSLDDGESFQKIRMDTAIDVYNILTEPDGMSKVFTVIGAYKEDSKQKFIATSLDFSSLKIKECQGVERAGQDGSDYEFWSPNDYKHGDQACLLGRRITFVRRRGGQGCYNGELFDKKKSVDVC